MNKDINIIIACSYASELMMNLLSNEKIEAGLTIWNAIEDKHITEEAFEILLKMI